MSTKKILVDDDLTHLKLMRKLLEKLGHIVVTTDSAEEAEHILRYEEHFSLIFTDLRMPWLNGSDFCRRVKILKPDLNLNRAIFYSICTDLLRIKDSRKSSTYPRVCLRFSRILMHQDLSTSLRKKSLNLG